MHKNNPVPLHVFNLTVGSQNVASWSLIRDNNGRITDKTETVGGVTASFAYTYDSMGRLLTVTKDSNLVENYGYDLSGTRISETNTLRGFTGRAFSYSDEDHLLTAGSVTYSYDLDGFLTTKIDGSDITSYTYSSRGELLNVTLPGSSELEYVHDPLGRRIAKKINGSVVEKYLWQGLTRLLAVYDGANNLLMRFEYADGRMPIALTAEGVTYYLAYDQVGSLRVVADSSGNVVKSLQYDSFGNIINDTNPSFEVPFGFAGGLHDQNTGLVRFGYRDYDPDIGRWTAKDPIVFAGGNTDLYGYVLNDPINLYDPMGYGPLGDAVDIVVALGIKSMKLAFFVSLPLAIITAPLGDMIDPNSLNKDEMQDYQRYLERRAEEKELENLQKTIIEIQKMLQPYLDRFHVEYDWDHTAPCP